MQWPNSGDNMNEYAEFLKNKSQLENNDGFKPVFLPDYLFGFQKSLSEWALIKGRSAIFADCGLGKSPMELVWSEVYGAVLNDRKGIGIELKESYYNQAVKNLKGAKKMIPEQELF